MALGLQHCAACQSASVAPPQVVVDGRNVGSLAPVVSNIGVALGERSRSRSTAAVVSVLVAPARVVVVGRDELALGPSEKSLREARDRARRVGFCTSIERGDGAPARPLTAAQGARGRVMGLLDVMNACREVERD